MKNKIPMRADGSFVVEAVFTVEGDMDRAQLEQWLRSWESSNQVWERTWIAAGQVIDKERLWLTDAFIGPPQLSVGAGEILILFHVAPNSRHWRDWLVEFIKAATGGFAVAFKSARHPLPNPS